MNLAPPRNRRRRVGQAAAIVASALCAGMSQADDARGDDNQTAPTWYPYLEPAFRLTEMETSEYAEDILLQETLRVARIMFPEIAEGEMPSSDFGAIVLPSFSLGFVLLFRESEGRTLVEKREMKRNGVFVRDMTPDEIRIVAVSRPLHTDIATASISAIRRALANARPHRPGNWVMMDGVFYYFFSRDDVGIAHSPSPDTEAGSLVVLVRVLGEFADDKAEERDLRVALENALRANHGSRSER